MTSTATRPSSSTSTMLRAVQVLATLSVLNLLYQFITAGTLFSQGEGLEEAHGTGAIVLHVLTGLTAIAAGLHWRATKGSVVPTVLAVVVFVLSFVQAYYGERSSLYIHIPGAMILTVGSVAVMAWSFTRAAAGRRA